jgi:hypothetical protein
MHLGTAGATAELRALSERLAAEYKLPLECKGAKGIGFGRKVKTAEEKEAALAEVLEKLGPGLYVFVEHPGMDVGEMRGMGHKGYEDVAADREGVTRAFCGGKVKEVISRKGIKLMSYGQVQGG